MRRFAKTKLEEAIIQLEEDESLAAIEVENSLKKAFSLLLEALKDLKLTPEQLRVLLEDEEDDRLQDLAYETELLQRLSTRSRGLANLFEGAARSSSRLNEFSEDLAELYDRWDEERQRRKEELTTLPGAPEATDYQRVQSSLRRRGNRHA